MYMYGYHDNKIINTKQKPQQKFKSRVFFYNPELFKLVALAIMVFDGFFKRILHKDKKPKQISILIIGLNNSGKSTIVNYFKNTDERRSISTIPTIGFQVEHFESKF